jgi:hypothetical protein
MKRELRELRSERSVQPRSPMKHTKKVIRPEKEVEITEAIECDLCKRKFTGYEWPRKTFEVLECKMELRTGKAYPDGEGWGESLTVDICPDCFKTKLAAWLESQGAKLRVETWGC